MNALAMDIDARAWTDEQLVAIERRRGELLLDAGAGSGKTSVLVERFVRMVLEDDVEVGAILAITFTEKAAAELRERIRRRLLELGAGVQARATEGAFISTIHGFCARVLRAHALAAGVDPEFVILDGVEAGQLADQAFEAALEELDDAGSSLVELLASYTTGDVRAAILALHASLRSRGMTTPELPRLGPAPDLEAARASVEPAAAATLAELAAVSDPGVRVVQAIERLTARGDVLGVAEPWPGALDGLALPGGNGAALSTALCAAYSDALARFRAACEHHHAERVHRVLDALLRAFGRRYAALKRERSAVDFEDLELMARDLLAASAELRERYRRRFRHVMVDELQDTNAVQLELIDQVASGNLFTVGDAQQSIYAFRNADVELFERLGERLEAVGARARLQTNFRSRGEILTVINAAFADVFGERFLTLRAGRVDEPAADPRVELLVVDKEGEWPPEALGAPWRVAEARALAQRLGALIADGVPPRDIVLLTRATTDLRVYERALEERGIPTYVIGGRGYWSHPQVVDMVAYLRALANPRDEESLYTVLASPLLGVSIDALVVLAETARKAERDPWSVLASGGEGALEGLADEDAAGLRRFAGWFGVEREATARVGVGELIERAFARSGYDLRMLAMPGGRRRLANVRKLTRLARMFEAAGGRDLRGFVDMIAGRQGGWGALGGDRESEAPIEGEALDAVRLMTIHRAKGLEFPVVCVGDLGRSPWRRVDLVRIGRDGRFGLRLSAPGTGRAEPALAYRALGEEALEAEAREERRLFYVAMTRAQERLIVSGAAKLETWSGGGPICWVGPALVPDIASLAADGGEGPPATELGVRVTLVRGGGECGCGGMGPAPGAPGGSGGKGPAPGAPGGSRGTCGPGVIPDTAGSPSPLGTPDVGGPAGPVGVPDERTSTDRPATFSRPPATSRASRLSYSSLVEYGRCGYRFYAERVLGLPPVAAVPGVGAEPPASRPVAARLGAAERGLIVHALLEKLDFRRPVPPAAAAVSAIAPGPVKPAEAREIAGLVDRFARSALCARLGRAGEVRREEPFAFLLDVDEAPGVMVTGALDVLAREAGGGMVIVDYKSDRLQGERPAAVVERAYATQRLIYALAGLRAGARNVEVAHLFLEAPDDPVSAAFPEQEAARLEAELRALAGGAVRGEFAVTDGPRRSICRGCPAEGGLCSWPLAMTRREAIDRLF